MPLGPPSPGPLHCLCLRLLHPPPLLLEYIKAALATGTLQLMFPLPVFLGLIPSLHSVLSQRIP